MKILEVKSLAIPEVKVIRFARFPDNRGYFSETFKQSDVLKNPELGRTAAFVSLVLGQISLLLMTRERVQIINNKIIQIH